MLGATDHVRRWDRRRLKVPQPSPPDDRLVVETPGGGGLGSPHERNRAAVAQDVAEGLVTARGARVYGG